MTRTLVAGLFLVLLGPLVAGVAVPSAPHADHGLAFRNGAGAATALDDSSRTGSVATQVGSQEFDRVVFRVNVSANGSARWTFVYKRGLNVSEQDDFEQFAENFTRNETDLYRDFRLRARSLVRKAENVTGRPMNATEFRRAAYVGGPLGNQGIVEMSFRWTNFANVSGSRVVVGDVFEGGLYVGPDQQFVVTWGESLRYLSNAPNATRIDLRDHTILWGGGSGGRQFFDEEPRVVFTTGSTGPATTTPNHTPDRTDGSTTPGGPSRGGTDSLSLAAGLGAVLVLVAVAAFAYRSGAFGGAATDDGPDDAGAAAASDASPAPEPVPEADDGAASSSASSAETTISDEELLTDEDRVMHLLEEHGGRMKQSNIVEETGWSKSKVSMLLSDMDEAGEISKLRVGRENIISLAGHEPEIARSPFDEDENG